MLWKLAALVALMSSGAALAREDTLPTLQLAGPTSFAGTVPTARSNLFDPPRAVPPSMEKAIGAPLFESVSDEALSFSNDVEARATAGGGDADHGAYILIEALAFVLGVIPGFGIGHLVGGSIFGFVTWLCVDIVIGVLLFWIFPILLFPAFQYMYTISVIAVVIERVFEGYSAFRAAYWNYGAGSFSNGGRPHDDRSGMAINASPNVASLHF